MKQKLNLEIGQKYRGYGLLNEFGEFEFIPEETGSRKGQCILFKEGDGWRVSYTKKKILVSLSVRRDQERMDRLKSFIQSMNTLIQILNTYEI